jgi:hypothetical protein
MARALVMAGSAVRIRSRSNKLLDLHARVLACPQRTEGGS